MKIATVVGTRPEIIRLSRVMAALDRHHDHIIIHTGQNYDYELNQIFFDDLEIRKPDYFLGAVGASAAETVGNIIAKVDAVLGDIQPDALLILGDTNSCLAAYPAKRRKIPVFHMEAGNRCFDQRVPEEINRKIVDHISDINLPYSSISRDYLLREGLPPDRVIKTGSPMFEVLHHYMPKILASDVLARMELKEELSVVSGQLSVKEELKRGAQALPTTDNRQPTTLQSDLLEYYVSGEKLEVVDIPPGYTHNIENLGDTDMVTVMWANEPFDPTRPDTVFEAL